MKLALTIISAALMATTTKFGSEAIHLENWRLGFVPTAIQEQVSEFSSTEAAPLVKVALNPVPNEDIQASLASLRTPEGPPAPEEPSLDAVCHSLAMAAQEHGIPTGFFARLIWQESKFKPHVVSHAGAQGVAQFMPAVAAERGLRDPFDPLVALPHSARFLREHLDYFGNLGLAAAAYNGGAGRVTAWLKRRGRLPQETRNYVKSITGHAPEQWTEENEIALAVNLPQRAPCEGVADLSRDAEPEVVSAQLEGPVARIVELARAEAARAAAAAKAKLAAAKNAKRSKLLAKGRGGKDKPARVAGKTAGKPKIAERAAASPSKPRSAKSRLAESSASRR
jgi:hypothetical protein